MTLACSCDVFGHVASTDTLKFAPREVEFGMMTFVWTPIDSTLFWSNYHTLLTPGMYLIGPGEMLI